MVKIMGECAYVQKNGTNSYHQYKYATAEDVLSKVNSAMVKYGVCSIVIPNLLSVEEKTNQKGNVEHLATVQVKILLIDSTSGESLEISGIGSGQDSGDKAMMKAQTASIKYAYIMSFAIATGEDPEADSKTDEITGEKTKNNNTSTDNNEANSSTKHVLNNSSNDNICEFCGIKLTPKVKEFSINKFNKTLCMKCQKLNVA